MTKVDAEVRARLKALLKTVIDDRTKSSLLDDDVLPGQFLQDNRIRVITHDFDNADSEIILNGPILFKPPPSRFLEDYPINPGYIKDSSARRMVIQYMEYTEPSFQDRSASERLGIFPRQSANYLGFDIFDSCQGQKYSSGLLEYDSGVHGVKPHIILLGAQANFGHNGSIMFGELVLITTAMRNRAYQPTVLDESDEEEANIKGKKDLLFIDENRFPVLMVSIIGLSTHEFSMLAWMA